MRTIAVVRGIPIRLDASWVIAAVAVTWLLFERLQRVVPLAATPSLIAGAAAGSLLFFAGIVAHELGHALTSTDRDVPVVAVTLFLLGGVTESTREARSARDEVVIVGIGPFISLVLGAAFGLIHTAVRTSGVPAAVTGYLAWLNVGLAVFNVIPGYPLDGGRLLRACLWAASGRRHAATRWAARTGQVTAAALVCLGLYQLFGVRGGGLGGVWQAFIGLFLARGATDAHRRARLRERLAGRSVADVMAPPPVTLDPDATLADSVAVLDERHGQPWPVGAPLVGVVTREDLDTVPETDWATTTLRSVATDPAQAHTAVDLDMPLEDALDVLVGLGGGQLLVTDGAAAVGLLGARALARLK